jgi:uncharacterized membrane protein (UPF0127 family)
MIAAIAAAAAGTASGRCLIVAALLLLCSTAGRAAALERGPLSIVTAQGRHELQVELATTPEQRALGLMFRQSLPADAGMLFAYSHEQPISMWMKNTLIPLDMLFIDDKGVIVDIAERAVPGSLAVITASRPARAVLELNGGTASHLAIHRGDRVIHPLFAGD